MPLRKTKHIIRYWKDTAKHLIENSADYELCYVCEYQCICNTNAYSTKQCINGVSLGLDYASKNRW